MEVSSNSFRIKTMEQIASEWKFILSIARIREVVGALTLSVLRSSGIGAAVRSREFHTICPRIEAKRR
jgi:hypothetical protein